MGSNTIQWTVQAASDLLQRLLADEPPESINQGLRTALLSACSVMSRFEIEKLNTGSGMVSQTDVESALRLDIVKLPRIPGEAQQYTLKPASRAEGLALLGNTRAMLSARHWNPIPHPDPLQQVFDQFLAGNYTAAEANEPAQLEAALQAAEWLEPYTPQAPSKAATEKRLAIRRLLHPMERLTRGFMGRNSDLATLRGFVGVLDPQSRVEAVSRFLTRWRASQSPLMLTGIGGVGKSTLLAEFIRQHVNSPVPFPWVYLDFDNPRLNVAALWTMIEEATDQLSAQYSGSNWAEVRAEARRRAALEDAATYSSLEESRTLVLGDVEQNEQMRSESAVQLASLFAYHLRQALERSELERMMKASELLPFLIVFDTFEEVQKRGVEMARSLWAFLVELRNAFPRLRVIVSGRAPVPELGAFVATPEPVSLKEFDEDSAVSFLLNREVSDPATARALYKQVGGNPLNLKLAAQVAKLDQTGADGIAGLKTTSYWVFAAAEHVIQGQLYQRILQRIPDETLQRLAHPGLVVRRITPDIIREVLAGPCGLGEVSPERAGELFQELEKQVDLVTIEPDGALRHQQDVRRVMLKMLESERPQQVREIHEAAFTFYQNALAGGTTDVAALIERIYHALQLGKDTAELKTLWSPEAAESLLSSVDELPTSSQLLVYEMTGRQVTPNLRALAGVEQWESVVEPQARRELQYGNAGAAERLIQERPERTPGSALYAIGAVCRMHSGDYPGAQDLLQKGIESAEAVNRIDRLVELYRIRGDLLRRQGGDYSEADRALEQAQSLALRMGTPVLALQICAERAREGVNMGLAPPVARLEEIVKATGDSDFASARLQLRGLFRVCGPQCLPLLLKGLRVFKLGSIVQLPSGAPWLQKAWAMADQGRLNEFLEDLLRREPANAAAVSEILEEALNPNVAARAK